MIYIIIYFVIGLFILKYYWDKYYEEEYNHLKEHDECEDSMVIILITFIMFFWPLKLIYELITYIKNK